MPTTPNPLILRGLLKINNVDVSDEVTHFKLTVNVATIVIPATLASAHINKGGSASYNIEVNYFATDGTDGVLFPILWTAATGVTKELSFEGYMRDGAASVTNPKYTGTLIVTSADLGGDINTHSVGSATFPLTGAWTKALA